MKKTKIASAFLLAVVLCSCTDKAPQAKLDTDIDSLSYAVGIARTAELSVYLTQQAMVDTTYMNDFIRGFLAGVNNDKPKDIAFVAGDQIGQMVSLRWVEGLNMQFFQGDSTKTIDKNNMIAGFMDGLKEKGKMNRMDAQAYVNTYTEKAREKALMDQFGEYKEEGERFLAENKNKEGVITLESGLQYKVIQEGKGEVPTESAKINVKYKGTLMDGTEFEVSRDDKPVVMPVSRFVQGMKEAVCLMPVGSRWEVYIPQELGYKSVDRGKVKPFSTLIYDVELIDIEK